MALELTNTPEGYFTNTAGGDSWDKKYVVHVLIDGAEFWNFVHIVAYMPENSFEARMDSLMALPFYTYIRDFVWNDQVVFTFHPNEICLEPEDLDFVLNQNNKHKIYYNESTDMLVFPTVTDLFYGLFELGCEITKHHRDVHLQAKMFELQKGLEFIEYAIEIQEATEKISKL